MIYYILIFLFIISGIVYVYYAINKRATRIKQYRKLVTKGDFGKIYVYADSSMDDSWYYLIIIKQETENMYMVKYRSLFCYSDTVLPSIVNVNRIFPCSKKEIKKFQSEIWWR